MAALTATMVRQIQARRPRTARDERGSIGPAAGVRRGEQAPTSGWPKNLRR